jgi:hypothetical protein
VDKYETTEDAMLNHQDYEDKLAASYPGWKTFEDVKRELVAKGYGFEIRNSNPHRVTIYKRTAMDNHELNRLINKATDMASSRGHDMNAWHTSDDQIWAYCACNTCGAQANVTLDPSFKDAAISGSAITLPCC